MSKNLKELSDKMKMNLLVCCVVNGTECPDPDQSRSLFQRGGSIRDEISNDQWLLCHQRITKILNGDCCERSKMEKTFLKLKRQTQNK
jgi:hypothetical protein